jgi:3-oxoacyl-[acyl-carrier-protein] synthase II
VTRRVAITGVGAVTPLGIGAETLVDRWAAGQSGIEDGLGRCSSFDPHEHLSRKVARRADRFTQFALVAADEALADAGWDGEPPFAPERIGCIVGTGVGGIGTIEEQHSVLESRGPQSVSSLTAPLLMPNAAAGVIAMRHGFRGHCYGTVSACAASAHALGAATRMVEHGDADACVVGGAEAAVTPLGRAAFATMGATSPSGSSRPFDRRRDGFVLGEGAGILVLEDEEHARARGARVHGVIAGYGASCDAFHLTAPEPSGQGAAQAIESALADAGVAPDEVDYVNAHGTSTPAGDLSETQALKASLGERAAAVPISSTKSVIGHLIGAAGAVELIATVLGLERAVAPPTVGWEERDEGLDLDYVPGTARRLEPRGGSLTAISNSFGFGGHNAVLCVTVATGTG